LSSELAKRAVACKHWRWLAGMLTQNTLRVLRVDDERHVFAWVVQHNHGWFLSVDALPDLDDPATLGCLLALVREAWSDSSLCANDAGAYDLMFWHVYTDDKFVSVGCQTEAEALVAALEAAP